MAVPHTAPETAQKQLERIGKMLNFLVLFAPSVAGKIAFRLFCTPRRLKIRESGAAFLATAEPGEFLFRNLRIRTYRWQSNRQDAPVVLLVHGWESSSARWYLYVKPLLQAGFSVQAFDAPASGHSEGKLLNVLMLSAAIRQYVQQYGSPYGIVGHSLGGAAAVMSLTMLETPQPEKLALMGVFSESRRVMHDAISMMGANQRVERAVFREIEKLSGTSINAYSVAGKAAMLTNVRGLVIHDTGDATVPVDEGRRIAASWGVPFMETTGLGHRLQDKSVVEAVVRFFQE